MLFNKTEIGGVRDVRVTEGRVRIVRALTIMPNGKQDFEITELPGLEAFFAPVAVVLEGFASRHQLKIEKYYHQNHAWDFDFRIPDAGGVGKIQVLRVDGDKVLVVGSRAMSDFERFQRSTYSWNCGTIARDDPRLPTVLRSLLQEMLTLPIERLVPDGRDYRILWSNLEAVAGARASNEALPLAILE